MFVETEGSVLRVGPPPAGARRSHHCHLQAAGPGNPKPHPEAKGPRPRSRTTKGRRRCISQVKQRANSASLLLFVLFRLLVHLLMSCRDNTRTPRKGRFTHTPRPRRVASQPPKVAFPVATHRWRCLLLLRRRRMAVFSVGVGEEFLLCLKPSLLVMFPLLCECKCPHGVRIVAAAHPQLLVTSWATFSRQ